MAKKGIHRGLQGVQDTILAALASSLALVSIALIALAAHSIARH